MHGCSLPVSSYLRAVPLPASNVAAAPCLQLVSSDDEMPLRGVHITLRMRLCCEIWRCDLGGEVGRDDQARCVGRVAAAHARGSAAHRMSSECCGCRGAAHPRTPPAASRNHSPTDPAGKEAQPRLRLLKF